jgi:imidazolonepropionase-like amidohydrolase
MFALRRVCGAVLAALAIVSLGSPGLRAGIATREPGRFTLFKFERPIGEERFEWAPAKSGTILTSSFSFTDRGTTVPLTAKVELDAAGQPTHFDIKGKTARFSSVDLAASIAGGEVEVRDHDDVRQMPAPRTFFVAAGYAPVSVQMLLVEYWMAHGRPAELALVPSGVARIEARGRDVVHASGRDVALERFSIRGIIWGREIAWCDAGGRLAAIVGVDAEFDHFEAVRPDLASALPQLVSKAASDGMAALTESVGDQTAPQGKAIAMTGATIIAMPGEHQPIAHGSIVVRDGRIVAVGAAHEVVVPQDATVIDARGKTIIPGLWDMHAHFEQVEWGPVYLASGVTTVRDVGNEFEFITAARDTIASRKGVGPRLLLAGVIDGNGPTSLGVTVADTPAEARRWVDRYVDAKFDQIKVYSSVRPDVLRAITDEAHRRRLTVTGHVPDGMTALEAVEAGMDQINHIAYVAKVLETDPQRTIETLKAHKTVVDPTLALSELLTRSFSTPIETFEPGASTLAPELARTFAGIGLPAEAAARGARVLETHLADVGALHRAGIPIVAGTDQAVPGYSVHREIELYVKAGFSPMAALAAATIVPATVMNQREDVGTIERGKRADLVVLDANPLDDISNTRRIFCVIANGRRLDPVPLWQSVGFQPR